MTATYFGRDKLLAGNCKRGFTLVEVMVAVIIAAIAVFGSIQLVSLQTIMIKKTQERVYVGQILQSRLEEMRDLTFDELLALGNGTITFTVHPAVDVFGRPVNTALDLTTYVQELDNSVGTVIISNVNAGVSNLKKIEVSVTWDTIGQHNSVTMDTMTYASVNGEFGF